MICIIILFCNLVTVSRQCAELLNSVMSISNINDTTFTDYCSVYNIFIQTAVPMHFISRYLEYSYNATESRYWRLFREINYDFDFCGILF